MQAIIHNLRHSCVRTLTLGVSVCTLTLANSMALAGPPPNPGPTTNTTELPCFSEAESHGLCTAGGNLTSTPDNGDVAGMKSGDPSAADQVLFWVYSLLGIDLK